MLAVFTLYSISLWLHISAAVVGLGATFALAVGFPLALKLDAKYLPFVHHLSLDVNRKLASPALLVLIVTGFYQAIDADSLDQPWVGATILIAIILGGMQGAYFVPTDKKLAALAEKELAAGATTLSERLSAPGAARRRDRRARRLPDHRRRLPDGDEARRVTTPRCGRGSPER